MFIVKGDKFHITETNEEIAYSNFINQVKTYIHAKDILKQVEQAYFIARKKHEGQKRITGEDFILHPISVATILANLNSEPNTLMAALLHDTLEDTDLTFEELITMFGEDVALIVKKTTKLQKLVFNQEQRQAENQQKMFLAMASDIRVVLIKIADRLHNMHTLQGIPREEKRIRISQETLSIYVPLTHRLGLFQIKSQLEDLAFRHTNPEQYYHISNLINIKKSQRDKSIENIINNIKFLFSQSNIHNFMISGRSKNIYSIYKKIQKKKITFEGISDLLAIRIIVDTVDLCYRCLGIIHAHYTPLPLKFKDYIAVPKPNLYQSLHNTVLSKDGFLFEAQIRTKQMHEIAEEGVAAHWRYKENIIYSKKQKQLEIVKKLKWYQDFIEIANDSENQNPQNSQDLVDAIKNDILNENVYVFTPEQEVLEFAKGSTPIDFAFRIHSNIGFSMTGAIVNNKIAPLSYELKNGDIVVIRTNKQNKSKINKEWLKIAKTSYAKKIIKKALHKQEQTEDNFLIQKGKELLDKELKNHKLEIAIDKKNILNYFVKQEITNINELYKAIGNKKISTVHIINLLQMQQQENDPENFIQEKISKKTHNINHSNDADILIEGVSHAKFKLANCCTPIFGENIIGFISKDKMIKIHRKNCINLTQHNVNQMIDVSWKNKAKNKYNTWIVLIGRYTDSLLNEINNKINNLGINILKLNIINNKKFSETTINLQIIIHNITEVDKIISYLSQIPNIHKIYRKMK